MSSERIQRRIERLLDQIEQEADQRNWQSVLDLANEILGFSPGDGDAKAFLGVAQERLSATDGTVAAAATPPPVPSASAVTQKTGQPVSFADGRYRVQRFLGEGGKKLVYLAHDTLLDREVAFALIKTEGLDETSRTRIQREAQAMGRLGSHPHIVTVFDLGQEAGSDESGNRPYMVTELMGGGDVEGLMEEAEGHRLPLTQAISIAQETCRGLEFAHSRGIVHRDLKPGNVWLTSDGVAKIGDFGLAVALDRSRLTSEGMMVGTVSYMPPEQAMGGEVTPQSDLYSLGAMIYEMVTGRAPFLGDDSVAIIGQHINTAPVAPTWHNPDCPRPLEALVIRLLAKSPNERPESAADVLAALDAIDLVVAAGASRSNRDSPTEERSLDGLAGGVFVGRQREMGELKGCLEDALSGQGRMVTLVGEPGIGKTRTSMELATYASLRQAQVLWGRCYEGQGAPSYWPWVQAIRSYVRDCDPEQLRSEMGVGAVDIAEIVSEVSGRLQGLPSPPTLEPEQARFRLFDSITAFLKSAGRSQPLILILEDLHWADQPSLLLLEFVARELAGARILIIGTYRDVELSRRHPLSQTLGELTRERLFQRVLLRGLGQGDVGRFIELVSGVQPPLGMVEAVYQQTEGNPLFVTEVVRLLVQEGELAAGEPRERDSWTIRIPEGVREVIGRRLDRLSERCNDTLTIASVIGRSFSLDQLKPLAADLSEDRLLEVLEEALGAKVIEELPQAVSVYQFTHALIQETLAEELTTTRRVRLHAQVAEVLESLYSGNEEAHAAELAYHFGEAQTVLGIEKLIGYSLLAGQQALSAYGYEDALEHFERSLSFQEDGAMNDQAAEGLFGAGQAHAAMFQRREALDCLTRAFDHYEETGDVDRAVAVSAFPINPGLGRVRITDLIRRALELAPADSREAGRLYSRYGHCLGTEMGDYQGAQEAFDKALAIARRDNDISLELWTLTTAGTVDTFFMRWQECVDKCQKVIDLAVAGNEPVAEALAHFWGAFAHMTLGDLAAAQAHVATGTPLAEKLRDRGLEVTSKMNDHILSAVIGDWEKAREFNDRGLVIAERDSRVLSIRVSLEYETGNFDRGKGFLDRMIAGLQATGPGPTLENAFAAALIPIAGRITGDHRDLDVAESAAKAVLSSPSAIPIVTIYSQAGLALIAVLRNDSVAAAEVYAQMYDSNESLLAGVMMTIDRILGLLAQTMNDLDKAVAHLDKAKAFCVRAGFTCELAWTNADLAACLLERNGEGDRARAISLMDESLAISSELGMRPLTERVLARREILSA